MKEYPRVRVTGQAPLALEAREAAERLIGWPIVFPAWLDQLFPVRRCGACTFARTQQLPEVHVRVTLCLRHRGSGFEHVGWEWLRRDERWLVQVPALKLRDSPDARDVVLVPSWVVILADALRERRTPQELTAAAFTVTARSPETRDFLVSLVALGVTDEDLADHIIATLEEHDSLRFLESETRAWAARRIAERNGILPSYLDTRVIPNKLGPRR